MEEIAATYYFIEKPTKLTRAEQRVFNILRKCALMLILIAATTLATMYFIHPVKTATPDFEGDTTTSASFDDFRFERGESWAANNNVEKNVEVTQFNTSDAKNIPHKINPKFNPLITAKDLRGDKINSMPPLSSQLNLIEDNDDGKKQRNVSILGLSYMSTLAPILIEENTTDINFNKTEIEVITTTTPTITTTTTATTKNGIKVAKKIAVYSADNFTGTHEDFELKQDCLTLPENWQLRISSMSTGGECAEICPLDNCGGFCTQVAPGTQDHKNGMIITSAEGGRQTFLFTTAGNISGNIPNPNNLIYDCLYNSQ